MCHAMQSVLTPMRTVLRYATTDKVQVRQSSSSMVKVQLVLLNYCHNQHCGSIQKFKFWKTDHIVTREINMFMHL